MAKLLQVLESQVQILSPFFAFRRRTLKQSRKPTEEERAKWAPAAYEPFSEDFFRKQQLHQDWCKRQEQAQKIDEHTEWVAKSKPQEPIVTVPTKLEYAFDKLSTTIVFEKNTFTQTTTFIANLTYQEAQHIITSLKALDKRQPLSWDGCAKRWTFDGLRDFLWTNSVLCTLLPDQTLQQTKDAFRHFKHYLLQGETQTLPNGNLQIWKKEFERKCLFEMWTKHDTFFEAIEPGKVQFVETL